MFLTYDRSAIREGYHAAMDTKLLPDSFTYEDTVKSLEDWEVYGVSNGETIGMCIIKDSEIHFCISPEYQGRWLTRSLLKEIGKLDFDYTTVPVSNFKNQRFVKKMGFYPVKQAGGNIIYKLRLLKWA